MIYGITGNARKDTLWHPVARLIQWLSHEELAFCLHPALARGLRDRDLIDAALLPLPVSNDLAQEADVVLSFGGDGTMLRTAHDTGINDTPLLGVNIGRLGFLADIEVETVQQAVAKMEAGDYRVERRMVLEATLPQGTDLDLHWALNEFVIDRSGATGMIKIEVIVDGTPLNTYWADGLIVATPTGSTAYSLSTGGPIIAPGCDAIILTPIAPHTLTVRPIVLPSTAEIQLRVLENTQPYVFAADGQSAVFERHDIAFRIRRAAHTVNLIKFPEQHYFKTLRSKLMWGAIGHLGESPTEDVNASPASDTPN